MHEQGHGADMNYAPKTVSGYVLYLLRVGGREEGEGKRELETKMKPNERQRMPY